MTEHDPHNPENSDNFDRLLANREQIADFVNSFNSERVQRKAFEAIVCSLGLSGDDGADEAPVERLHVVPPPATETVTPEGTSKPEKQSQWDEDLTLGEFIVDTEASTFQQKICAAGYYLMKIRGAESFTSSDIKTALADAHEDMPGNFSRDFSDAASKNYVARKQGGEPNQFIVPRTGRTAVESKFTEIPKRRPRRAAKKTSTASDEATA